MVCKQQYFTFPFADICMGFFCCLIILFGISSVVWQPRVSVLLTSWRALDRLLVCWQTVRKQASRLSCLLLSVPFSVLLVCRVLFLKGLGKSGVDTRKPGRSCWVKCSHTIICAYWTYKTFEWTLVRVLFRKPCFSLGISRLCFS